MAKPQFNIGGVIRTPKKIQTIAGGVSRGIKRGQSVINGVIKYIWLPLINVYELGMEYLSIVQGYSNTNTSMVKNSQSIDLKITGVAGATTEVALVTDTPIDLTGYTKVYLDWESSLNFTDNFYSYLIASTSKDGTHATTNASLVKTKVFARETSILDVSTLNGLHYIRVHLRIGASGNIPNIKTTVYKMWIE